MKNYYNLSEIKSLFKITDKLIDSCNIDILDYLKKMPLTEKSKFYKIIITDFIKMYYIPIKYTISENLPKRNLNELFNFSVDSVEQNQDNGNGIKAKEIEDIFDMNYYKYYDIPFFCNVLDIIPENVHSSWVIFYKKGAVVHPHSHDHTTIITHVLLEDITNGDFIINVKGEEKRINKKGEYFIFCGGDEHSAFLTGNKAKFITFSIEKEDINNLYNI